MSEAIANLVATLILRFVTQKVGFACCYYACLVSCGLVMFAEIYEWEFLVALGVLVGKASITTAFCFLYFTTVDYF